MSIPFYTPAAANTRYVGVATERVVRQLNPGYIHCIGHSLGAHTCGFFGNALVTDGRKPLDRISAMDPAGPNWYDGLITPDIFINSPLDEKLDATDASLVDAIHTDSDLWGTAFAVGHTDFYVGENTNQLGADQADSHGVASDHGRSYELMLHSIDHPSNCWAHFPCHGQPNVKGCKVPDTCDRYPPNKPYASPNQQNQPFYQMELQEYEDKMDALPKLPHTYHPDCNSAMSPRPHFGYWYDGSQPGQYGIVLTSATCWQCVGDEECSGVSGKCDVTTPNCVSAECLRDHHCSSGQTCVNKKCDPPKPLSCEGRRRRRRQADHAQCSSEPSEQCKAKSGYCGNPTSCPGTVLDNLCPGGLINIIYLYKYKSSRSF